MRMKLCSFKNFEKRKSLEEFPPVREVKLEDCILESKRKKFSQQEEHDSRVNKER